MSQNRHTSTTNIFDLHFIGQRFELSTLGSSNVIISQVVTDRTNNAITNIESRMWPFDWHIYILPWTIVKVWVKVMNFSTVNISQMVTVEANIAIANK